MITAACLTIALGTLADNTLTFREKREGWKLLFDGTSTKGWHNFKQAGIGPGWVVKDGVLKSENPDTAGDIVTDERFEWFELEIDVRIDPGQNSGILIHVADYGAASWHSAPEIQIYDAPMSSGQQITGWLYQLYPATVDASKPAGQWNHMRILIDPKKCATWVNGVKYYEYEMYSKDFWARVAKSKFAEHPEFAKTKVGRIGIQGDHGVVSFKNVKIRPIGGAAAKGDSPWDGWN